MQTKPPIEAAERLRRKPEPEKLGGSNGNQR